METAQSELVADMAFAIPIPMVGWSLLTGFFAFVTARLFFKRRSSVGEDASS
jgi:hypothetical protein